MSELNIRKRGNKWEYRFEGAKIDGKRKQITKGGFSTKKECAIAGAKALQEYNNSGLYFEPSEISVADYLNYWFDNYCRINLKYNTQVDYWQIITTHLIPIFGTYKLKSLNTSILQEYANELKLKGLARATAKNILCLLSSALDYAIEPLQYIKDNPMRLVKFPMIDKKKRERIVLSREQYNTIISRFKDTRYYLPLVIGYHTGLRISEALGLTWDDINLQNRTITINKQVCKRNFGNDVRKVVEKKHKKELRSSWYFTTLKVQGTERTIKIDSVITEILKKEKLKQQANELKYGEYFTIHVAKKEVDEKGNEIIRIVPVQKCLESSLPRINLVSIHENGLFTSPDCFKFASRVIHHELHINFDYHSFRHTHATLLIENGADVKDVQARLGHKSIKTTLQTYVHDTEEMQNRSVEIFEKIVHQ